MVSRLWPMSTGLADARKRRPWKVSLATARVPRGLLDVRDETRGGGRDPARGCHALHLARTTQLVKVCQRLLVVGSCGSLAHRLVSSWCKWLTLLIWLMWLIWLICLVRFICPFGSHIALGGPGRGRRSTKLGDALGTAAALSFNDPCPAVAVDDRALRFGARGEGQTASRSPPHGRMAAHRLVVPGGLSPNVVRRSGCFRPHATIWPWMALTRLAKSPSQCLLVPTTATKHAVVLRGCMTYRNGLRDLP